MYPVYQGVARQRGHGLGDMLKSAYRTVVPVLKPMVTRGLHALKDAALTHGKDFLQNVLIDKQNPKEAFLRAGKNVLLQTGKDLLGRRETPINATIAAESGIPASLTPQQGQGRKRRRRKHPFRGLHALRARKTKKRKTVRDLDVFDY
jgi:hypothetical protein